MSLSTMFAMGASFAVGVCVGVYLREREILDCDDLRKATDRISELTKESVQSFKSKKKAYQNN